MEEFQQQQTMESEESREISFKGFFVLMWRNVILIAVITVLSTALGLIFAIVHKPSYVATRTLILKVSADTHSTNGYNDTTIITRVLPSVAEYFKTVSVVSAANELYGNSELGKISNKKISVSYDNETNFISISYTDTDEEIAKKKVNYLVEAGVPIITKTTSGVSDNFSVNVMLNTSPDNGQATCLNRSHRAIYVLVGLLGGLVIAVIVVLIKYFIDDTIKSKQDLEMITGVKVLAYLENIEADAVRENNGGTGK